MLIILDVSMNGLAHWPLSPTPPTDRTSYLHAICSRCQRHSPVFKSCVPHFSQPQSLYFSHDTCMSTISKLSYTIRIFLVTNYTPLCYLYNIHILTIGYLYTTHLLPVACCLQIYYFNHIHTYTLLYT